LNDVALHETSVPIRTAAIELLSRDLDEAAINQLITIYRSANSLIIKSACLRGLGVTDSKTAKEFLISIAKADPDPQLRRMALRAIAGETGIAQGFAVNGKRIAAPPVPPDELQQQTGGYRRRLDGMDRLRDEGGIVISRRMPEPGDLRPQNQLFFMAPHLREGFGPHLQSPDSPKQFPEEPKVDPSPKPSPSVNE
jgi:hypothetical protein